MVLKFFSAPRASWVQRPKSRQQLSIAVAASFLGDSAVAEHHFYSKKLHRQLQEDVVAIHIVNHLWVILVFGCVKILERLVDGSIKPGKGLFQKL